MVRDGRKSRVVALVGLLLLLLWAAPAAAWWHDDWTLRRKIVLKATGIEGTATAVPVLVRLHTGNLSFASLKEDGSDLRFVAADDKTQLRHHVERLDPLEEMALVWVSVPQVGSGENFIWMYYGNEAAEKGDDVKGTYDVNQVAVFHFAEAEGAPQDATAYGNHARSFSGAQGLPSAVGSGISLAGTGGGLRIAASPSLKLSGGFTFSTWIKVPAPQQDAYILCREENGQAIVVGLYGAAVYVRVQAGPVPVLLTETDTNLTPDTWHHLAVTVGANRRLAIYLDGTPTYQAELPMALPEIGADVMVGSSGGGENRLIAELDEVAISNTARSAAWIKASADSQGPGGQFLAFGEEEAGEGGGFFQFQMASTLRNMSLDGWMIVATTLILGAVSLVVFVNKAYLLRLAERENASFMDSFRALSEPLALQAEEGEFLNSTLYEVYESGRRELKGRLGNPGHLTPKALNAFKTALEKGAVRAAQRLDRWLVILTLAISGAPFLGLLGTVWGVMTTFSNMSATGEASIMAIAPGIASALITTLVGLLVAIPSLFAYNYLASKIKNLTADMYVFIDEFTCQADEAYGDKP